MRISLRWKISGILLVSNLILGLALVLLINRTVAHKIEGELVERGRVLAANLANYSSEPILSEDKFGLKKIISDALSFESVKYILIQDGEKNILADTFNGDVPLEIKNILQETNRKGVHDITLKDSGTRCCEIVQPVQDGYLGYIRVGMKQDYIDKAVYDINKLIVYIVGGLTIFGIIVVLFLANRIISPLIYLTQKADEISQGKLDERIVVNTHDEIENLGAALERLRESVKIALDRLKNRRSTRI